jgi:hypothetical protein
MGVQIPILCREWCGDRFSLSDSTTATPTARETMPAATATPTLALSLPTTMATSTMAPQATGNPSG